jgi:hypothetical protein
MTLLLHGVAGGWDELLIALVAVGVLWIAVKLAGRRSAAEDEDDPLAAPEAAVDVDGKPTDPVPPHATKLS